MIYFIQAGGEDGAIKIGFTADDDALGRLATLQTGNSLPLRLLGTAPGTLEDERNLHRRFAGYRVQGEWFAPTADLLAIIASGPFKRLNYLCGDIETLIQTVTIRVLTIGRKQFSKKILEQLPKVNFFYWSKFVNQELGWHDYMVEDFTVWGWIMGSDWCKGCRERHLVVESGGRLYTCDYFHSGKATAYEYQRRCHLPMHSESEFQIDGDGIIDTFFYWLGNQPGFRDEDQIFIGV